jgi:RsbT co-antagonist protein rsbRD N-terminal domain
MPNLSAERKQAIAQAWLDLVLSTYPSQSMQFMLHETDCFRNPVGKTLKEGIPLLVDELFGGMDLARVHRVLEEIVRIRAVQNFSAREAVGFVFLVKRILHEKLSSATVVDLELDDRVDEMALTAFDLYALCRGQISDIQVNEARRRVALLQRIYSGVEGR